MEHDNDNDEELSFELLACANRRVVMRLTEVANDEDAKNSEDERSRDAGSDEDTRANLKVGIMN